MSEVDWSNVPATERAARELGCTCAWWGRGSIAEFDPDCPILDRHHGVPLEVAMARARSDMAAAPSRSPLLNVDCFPVTEVRKEGGRDVNDSRQDGGHDESSPHVTGTTVLDVPAGSGIIALENAVDAEIRKLEVDGFEILSVSHAAMQEMSGEPYWTAIITYRKDEA